MTLLLSAWSVLYSSAAIPGWQGTRSDSGTFGPVAGPALGKTEKWACWAFNAHTPLGAVQAGLMDVLRSRCFPHLCNWAGGWR